MENSDLVYKIAKPEPTLSGYVDSFWMMHNQSGKDKTLVVLPDGQIDVLFYQSETEPIQAVIMGINTYSDQVSVVSGAYICGISFKLAAVDSILTNKTNNWVDGVESLPANFWNFDASYFYNFDRFCKTMSQKIQATLPKQVDKRKQLLFDLIYTSNGTLTVKELSEKVCWSSRQINRYFSQHFGISMKAYCTILRFRASLKHLSEGKLFPEQNFSDQNHFIKTIKRYAGVTPKTLSKDERFFSITILRNT